MERSPWTMRGLAGSYCIRGTLAGLSPSRGTSASNGSVVAGQTPRKANCRARVPHGASTTRRSAGAHLGRQGGNGAVDQLQFALHFLDLAHGVPAEALVELRLQAVLLLIEQ